MTTNNFHVSLDLWTLLSTKIISQTLFDFVYTSALPTFSLAHFEFVYTKGHQTFCQPLLDFVYISAL